MGAPIESAQPTTNGPASLPARSFSTRRTLIRAVGEENSTLAGVSPWLDENYSHWEELRDDGSAEVILVNFRHAPR